MINRTAERVLTWIGIVLHALYFLIFAGLLVALNLNATEFKQSMLDSETTMEDASGAFIIINVFLIVIVIIALIMLVLGILSARWIGKRNKPAGVILIVIGAFSLFGSPLIGVLWIVAGIMLLVRKPKPEDYHNKQNSFETFEHQEESDFESKDELQSIDNNVNNNQKQEDPYKY
ncbi:DUF4064 domain-containing protein [Staphylococcus gallinarum]|uniref:DUF4064 domain-containing protein n=1 Tax=Staphylococcus gallinarum TaxID=1293 RepID=UPI000D1DE6A7|nr:DUF4064 domain-containing protein [Staphylococcus gallinarum]PTK93272.1 hypothetical protein BUZ05_07710 [Staphylococcus gallinarum]PTK93901.1 hypothetical protein BUZ13_05605 [Staphylococcus gallinarum]RIO89710.1 DUF4064 domain-containing protein [Staphylococcus gallinarum]